MKWRRAERRNTMFNSNFYPTPEELAHRMFDKVDFANVETILEPSAGKGDLIKALGTYRYKVSGDRYYIIRDNRYQIHAIEIESDLQSILNDLDHVSVIDSDFLSHTGSTHYDLIFANFPFSDGDMHLHKALDMLFCGQIVCLLNAETIKNPYTNSRKDLVAKLTKLGADIEYIQHAFVDAERKTDVEVALIYLKIERTVEIDVFGEMNDDKEAYFDDFQEQNELSTKDSYHDLVAKYNQCCKQVGEQLLAFYKNYKNVAKYVDLQIAKDKDYYRESDTLTEIMRKKHNNFVKKIKSEYWQSVTELPEVSKYLTSKEQRKMSANSHLFYCKEFTISNIQQFVLNLVKKYPEHINDAILDLFDTMTSYALKDRSWRSEELKNNIHYFNAWKTNSGYKINKKVILPFYCSRYSSSSISYEQKEMLNDMEKVMRYFKPSTYTNINIGEVCERALSSGQNRKIETDYFFVSIFKKGTIHLEFKDKDLLRRFNIEACKMKNFIPKEYSDKDYSNLNDEEREIVTQFEGKASYKPFRDNIRMFNSSNLLALEHKLA